MIIFAFIMLFLTAIGSLFYFLTRFHKFQFLRNLAGERKKLSWLLAGLPVLLLVVLFFLQTVNATIIALHLFAFWLLADLVTWIVKKTAKKESQRYYAGAAAILITTIYLCIGWYYGHHVFETHYTVSAGKELGVDQIRIVQISDSHLGCTFDGDGFAAYMKRVQKTSPDLVVVTGDYVDDDSKKAEMIKASKALGELKTTYGVYFVYGNHDKGYFGYRDFTAEELEEELQKNGVHILKDEVVRLDEHVVLIGRNDRSEKDRKEMAELVGGLDVQRDYLIVLDHQPHDFDAQEKAGVDLVLCGHTHGGQMFPVGITGELTGANDKTYGLEKRGATTFIVNSGISDWAIPYKTAAIAEYGVIDVLRDVK